MTKGVFGGALKFDKLFKDGLNCHDKINITHLLFESWWVMGEYLNIATI